MPSRTDITGNDYLKAPVDEHFSIKNGNAHWKSTSEDGTGKADGFYISNNGPAAESAVLVAALLKAKNGPVKLLPAGEARLERLNEATLEDHGQKTHVTEFAITGLSFEPQTIWLDDNQRFFASPGPWFAILREGWEGTNQQLYDLQVKAQNARYERLAQELTRRPGHPVAIGPRVWKCGFIDGHGPFQAPTGLYADTAEEAQAAVNRYADLGYIQIKLYSSLKPEFVPGIAKTAHERGMRLSGHVPNGMIATQFVEAGADELQHINFIFLNFLASQVKDTRTPERVTAVGANAAKLDLDSKPVKDFIELLQKHHTTVDVTLATFESMFTGRPGVASPDFGPVLSRLPAQVQRGAYSGGLPVTSENDQLYKDSYGAMLRMTKWMYDVGIPILAGTDALAGLMLHRELELEVKAGIPPARALQIATFNAAGLLRQGKGLGSIAPGKLADLVLVEGNPTEKISDIRRCRLVAKNGVLFKSDAVYAAVGIKPAD